MYKLLTTLLLRLILNAGELMQKHFYDFNTKTITGESAYI